MELISNLDINDIINKNKIATFLQPVISVKRKSIIGYEALVRGINEKNGNYIMPKVLFKMALKKGLLIELDRLCRRKAIETFKKIYDTNPNLVLFMNFETAILDNIDGINLDHIINLVREYEVNQHNIIIEIVESKANNISILKKFIKQQRDYGFLIALDDVGAGHSNLDRITLIKPDIIKVDGRLIKGIEQHFYKQEVFKSLVNLARKIGALIVAEWIEKEIEAFQVLEYGADMLQGFYFAEPHEWDEYHLQLCNETIKNVTSHFKKKYIQKISSGHLRIKEYKKIVKIITHELSQVKENEFDRILVFMMKSYEDFVDSLYVIDEAGIQISNTVVNSIKRFKRDQLLFQPAKKGTDHSLKEYYFILKDFELDQDITQPYISSATGNLCVTVSFLFKSDLGKNYLLCVDFNSDFE